MISSFTMSELIYRALNLILENELSIMERPKPSGIIDILL